MSTIRDILAIKGTQVAAIDPSATVYEAAQMMNQHKIGSLVVLSDDELVGIITERDILQRVVAERLDAATSLVGDVMSNHIVCGRLHTSVEEVRVVMKDRRIRHLPVLDEEGKLIGLVSIGDLNAFEAHSREQTIFLMQEYITGRV